MLRVGIVGFSGRMGQLITQNLAQESDLKLSCIFTHQNSPLISQEVFLTNDWNIFLKSCDCVIDFSNHNATHQLLKALLHSPKPSVIGTTGLQEEDKSLLQEASKTSAIVYATNTSQGIALLNQLAFLIAQTLQDSDIEISEFHHNKKKDSPSGTAMTLAEFCAKGRGLDLQSVRVSGRDGNIGERSKNEIGVMSFRGGDIVGKHTVGFYCDGEYLELTHNATNRNTFAKGAIRALKWVAEQKSGLYSMQDVLKF